MHEQLLDRLAASSHTGSFELKGATLFTVWTGHSDRATRDLDELGFGDSSEADLRTVFAEIAATPGPDDGVTFDPATIETGPIRGEEDYGGVRVHLEARVSTGASPPGGHRGRRRHHAAASVLEFPALLDFPAPLLRAYPRETVAAEKLEAMVKLGLANSRMKDFYDQAILARLFPFDGAQLASAIRATFERRGTALLEGAPIARPQTSRTLRARSLSGAASSAKGPSRTLAASRKP